GGAGLVTGGAEVVDAGLALGGRLRSSSFESSSFSSGVDGEANAAFLVADTNLIDTFDQGEFHQFPGQNAEGAGGASYESYSLSYSY
ncbi:unnamed protein product, partial [Rotaria sordida]